MKNVVFIKNIKAVTLTSRKVCARKTLELIKQPAAWKQLLNTKFIFKIMVQITPYYSIEFTIENYDVKCVPRSQFVRTISHLNVKTHFSYKILYCSYVSKQNRKHKMLIFFLFYFYAKSHNVTLFKNVRFHVSVYLYFICEYV